jgi:hypothetical protein
LTAPISPGGDDLARLLQLGDVAVGEVHHVDEAHLLGHLGHLHGLGIVGRQRLFAEHVLAGLERRH